MFVAPVVLGDDAWTAAGTVVTDDVPENALAGFPPRQVLKEDAVDAGTIEQALPGLDHAPRSRR